MKQFIKITLSLLFIAASFTSCVDDKDFDTPQITETDNDIHTASFLSAKDALIQNLVQMNDPNNSNDAVIDPTTLVYTFPELLPNESNLIIIPAYVVSDDTAGNFYKKLIVQDKPENPTGGLEIMINEGNLHTLYNVGRKIYIKLNGLSIGYFDGSQGGAPNYPNQSVPAGETLADVDDNNIPGVYKLGVLNGSDLERISELDFTKYITRSSISETIVPKIVQINSLTDATMNISAQLEDMQFEYFEEGKSFAGGADDSYDATRVLKNCTTETNLGLMTSTYSSFKSLELPTNKGTVTGILMKDYRENNPVIVLNSPNDINFYDTDRCDPDFLNCGNNNVGGPNIIFEEDFEAYSDDTTNITGWTNVNTTGGSRIYRIDSYSGNSFMGGSAYGSGENPLEMWFVTPAINLDSTSDEELTFSTQAHHDDGAVLKTYVSTDFTGDVTSATWTLLNAVIGTSPGSNYGDFESSGSINLSCLDGDVYIAFKYVGGDGLFGTGMNIDNVKVTGN